MGELKPCPFCGGGNIRLTVLGPEYCVFCDDCGGMGDCASEAPAIAAWNRRAPSDESAQAFRDFLEGPCCEEYARAKTLGVVQELRQWIAAQPGWTDHSEMLPQLDAIEARLKQGGEG